MSESQRTNLAILATLACITLIGAGCASVAQNTLGTVSPQGQETTDLAPSTPVTEPTSVACTKDAEVTFVNKNDTNTEWNISLNGQLAATVSKPGESTVYLWREVPGKTYLAYDPSGLGGYIPYGAHQDLYAVDHCTGMVTHFTPPGDENTMSLFGLSEDGAQLASISMYEGTRGTQFHVKIWNTADVLLPLIVEASSATPAQEFTIPGNWSFAGSVRFNNTGTKLEVAAGTGPDNEASAVYEIDLQTGNIVMVKTADSILYSGGWDKNGTPVTTSVPPTNF